MPDDVPDTESDEASDVPWTVDEPESGDPAVGHDDIMKRLLDYQRSLREGASPVEAAEAAKLGTAERPPVETSTATSSLLDLSSAEPEPEPEVEVEPEPALVEIETETEPEEALRTGELSRTELQARVAKLEATLERLESKLGEIRHSFREMAISADERLASVEDEIGEARPERNDDNPG